MKHHTLRVGVTGGIGSGKSSVCAVFESIGVPVLYADDLAKELADSDPTIKKRIIKLLGARAYLSNGMLDRAYVAEIIFGDGHVRESLNRILHPEVEQEIDRRIEKLEKDGHSLAIVEAALIYESGLDSKLDFIVVVDAPERIRVRWVAERDNVSLSDVRKRMNVQWSVARKRKLADFIIDNEGQKQELETKVRFLYRVFQTLAAEDRC